MSVAGVRVYRDVVYARPPGYRPLALDLYLPGTAPAALCLYLHGGGWRIGSRREGPGNTRSWSPSFFERVAAAGLAIASADYRLSGEAHFPAQLADVTAALAFLRERGPAYGTSGARMVAWGVSAGGHLAALLGLGAAVPGDPPGGQPAAAPVDAVDAVVCWYPPTDLEALSADVDEAGGCGDRGPQSREAQLIGAPLSERPDAVRAAGPVHHVRPGAPPFLFLHGTADRAVPPRQSERLAEALVRAGGSAVVELVDGATHMFPELDDAATWRIVERSVRFLLAPAP